MAVNIIVIILTSLSDKGFKAMISKKYRKCV